MPPYDPVGTGSYVPVARVKPITADFVGDLTKGGSNQVQAFLDARRAYKAPCRVATVAALPAYTRSGNVITSSSNVSLNTAGIDGVTNLAVGDRVLLKNGAAGADNGIYSVTTVGSGVAAFVLTRASDADSSTEMVAGAITAITEGTTNADTLWQVATNGAITLNTSSLTFSQIGSSNATTLGGLSASAFQRSSAVTAVTSLTSAYNATVNSILLVKLTAAATANIVFPAGAAAGDQIVVKDASGNFATYNVTLARSGTDTIEGDTSILLNLNRMSVTFVSDGSGGWWLI